MTVIQVKKQKGTTICKHKKHIRCTNNSYFHVQHRAKVDSTSATPISQLPPALSPTLRIKKMRSAEDCKTLRIYKTRCQTCFRFLKNMLLINSLRAYKLILINHHSIKGRRGARRSSRKSAHHQKSISSNLIHVGLGISINGLVYIFTSAPFHIIDHNLLLLLYHNNLMCYTWRRGLHKPPDVYIAIVASRESRHTIGTDLLSYAYLIINNYNLCSAKRWRDCMYRPRPQPT